MTKKRLWHTLRLWLIRGDSARANYARKCHIYGAIGNNVSIMDRKIPLYAELIRFHDNIQVASNVTFITHDVIHNILNSIFNDGDNRKFQETIGCIEIMDNVFIGSGSIIFHDVRIGANSIIAAGSVVTKDVPPHTVYGGVPAREICSLDDYIEKRKETRYPVNIKPKGQNVCPALTQFMWKAFYECRQAHDEEK